MYFFLSIQKTNSKKRDIESLTKLLTKLIVDTETNIQNTAPEHQDTLRHNVNNIIGAHKRPDNKNHNSEIHTADVYKRQPLNH